MTVVVRLHSRKKNIEVKILITLYHVSGSYHISYNIMIHFIFKPINFYRTGNSCLERVRNLCRNILVKRPAYKNQINMAMTFV